MNRIDKVTHDTLSALKQRERHAESAQSLPAQQPSTRIDISLSGSKAQVVSEAFSILEDYVPQDDVAFARAVKVALQLKHAGYAVTVHAPKNGGCRVSVESRHVVQ